MTQSDDAIARFSRRGVGEAIAHAYGVRRKGVGSITALFRELLRMEYVLVPNGTILNEDQLFQVAEVLRSLSDRVQARQPFQLIYQHANGDRRSYTVRYAEVVVHDRRYYVDAWVAELDDRQPAELAHNRSFRLDRIEAIGAVVGGDWRDELDSITVSFKVLGALALSCEKKIGDSITLGDGLIFISRNITSAFWFVREILLYGADCVVLEPAEVRDRVKGNFEKGLKNYA